MKITEELKNKIIENKIILEKDWPNVSEIHIVLAKVMLDFLESQPNDEVMSEFEQIQFASELSELQDKVDLRECDKVKSDADLEKEFQFVSMKIPASFARFIREEIFPKMRETLKN